MKTTVLAILALTLFGSVVGQAAPPSSPAELDRAATRILESSERLATAINFAFDHLATFIALSGAPDQVIHQELKDTTARLNGVRSILVVAKDGSIQWDTISFPPPALNLSSRNYIRNAFSSTHLVFDEVTVGKTSGFPFVPVAAYKPAIGAVIAGVLDPRELQRPMEWCPESCGGALLTREGRIIVISPVETRLSFDLISEIRATHAAGAEEGILFESRENFNLRLAWIASGDFPIYAVAFSYTAIPPTSSLN